MENASKALLMAGGISLALLVIGALLLMFNQIGSYQQFQTDTEKNTQIAEFNIDFERYLDDDGISGTDIVTLANKITDYNSKEGTTSEASNSVNYSIKMTLTVDMTGFSDVYGYSKGGIFSDGEYVAYFNDTSKTTTGNLINIINTYNSIFSGDNKKIITLLTDVYDRNKSEKENQTQIENTLKELNKDSSLFSVTQIKNYKEYTEFRTSTFKVDEDAEYEDGQIKTLYFKWDS